MLHVHREDAQGETCEKTRKNRETNYRDDRLEHFPTPTISYNDMKKEEQVSDEKEVGEHIEYSSGNDG